jgi:hypothetical protein
VSTEQLDTLIEELRVARNIEAAAELDLHDREMDLRAAKSRWSDAQARLKDAHDSAMNARLAVHSRIEAQTHSIFDDELDGK